MNCKHVQELLPLYVGRDLDEKSTGLVTAHIRVCQACSCLRDEYRETRALLGLFEPPPFTDADYASIRRSVLHEIERGSVRPTLAQWAAALLERPMRLAAPAGLLLAIAAFAWYFVALRGGDRKADEMTKTVPSDQDRQTTVPSPQPNRPSADTKRGAETNTAGASHRDHRSGLRKPVTVAAKPRGSVLHLPDARTVGATVSPAGNRRDETRALRMEMQTRDPNIRIIWFTPQTVK